MDTGSNSHNIIQMPGLYQRLAWNSPFTKGINSIASGIGHYTKPAMNRAFLLSSWYNRMSKRTGPWPGSLYIDKVYSAIHGNDVDETVDEANIQTTGKPTKVKGTVETRFGEAEPSPVIARTGPALKLSLLMPFKPVNKTSEKQIDALKSQLANGKTADHKVLPQDYMGGIPDTFKVWVPGRVKPLNAPVNHVVVANKYLSENETLADVRVVNEVEKPVQNLKEEQTAENILLSEVNRADELLMFRPSKEELFKKIKKQSGEGVYSRKLDMVNELGIVEPASNSHIEKNDKEPQNQLEPEIKSYVNKESIVYIDKTGNATQKRIEPETNSFINQESMYNNERLDTVYRVKGKSQRTGWEFKTLSDAMAGIREHVVFKPALNLATRRNGIPNAGETSVKAYDVVPVLQDLAYGRQLLNNNINGFEPSVFERVNQPNRREIPASSYSNQAFNVKIVGQNQDENTKTQIKNESQGWPETAIEHPDIPDAGYNSFLPYTEAISDQVFERLLEITGQPDKGSSVTPPLTEGRRNSNDKASLNNVADKGEGDGGNRYSGPMIHPKADVGLIVEEVYKRVNGINQTEKERKGLY